MSILTVSNLEKGFGVDLLFSGVNFSIASGDKLGLVGRNGSGKTTLLRVLMGQEPPDIGRVSLASGRRLGYVKQEAPVHPDHTLIEEVHSVFAPVRILEAEMNRLEHEMTFLSHDDKLDAVLNEYSELRDQFEAAGGYHYASDVDLVLTRLGFMPADYDKTVGSCSGGEQTRLALAKIVLSKPDLLVLDEPTNHLDIDATEWLEGFLQAYEGAVILVSHDRYFLDSVTTAIADLDNQSVTVYRGNYTQFWKQKQDQIARQQALFEQRQDEVSRLEEVIKKNMGADSVQSRMRHRIQGRIDRMEKAERPDQDTTAVRARFDAESAGRVGREVVRLDGLAKSYGDQVLFSDLDCVVERGMRIGLVGANGTGKTTLVKILLGLEQPTDGIVSLGHNVRLAYFSQHAADSLPINLSVIDTLLEGADMTSTEARNYLARFLFVGDDVFKLVSMLSGGEKNKLALARMILEPCNLLILDEPTNHLDIASCEVLTEMLSQYDGTLLLVSHDRYLLNATTNATLSLSRGGCARLFPGNYASVREQLSSANAYLQKDLKSAGTATVVSPAVTKQPAVQSPLNKYQSLNARELSKARVKSKELLLANEAEVSRIECAIAETETMLAQPSTTGDAMVKLAAEHTRLQDDLMTALVEWERASTEHDIINAQNENTSVVA